MTVVRSFALVPAAPLATDAYLRRALVALPKLSAEVVGYWSPVYSDSDLVVPAFKVALGPADLVDGDVPIVLSATIDVPDVDAYHAERGPLPYGVVWMDGAQTTASLEQSLAHEVAEALVDPDLDRYDLDGVAVEVMDALEDTAALVDVGDPAGAFTASPVTLPAWFNITGTVRKAGEPVDSAGVLSAPGELGPGGYKTDRSGRETFGRDRARHTASKLGPHSRRSRRLRKLGLLSMPLVLAAVALGACSFDPTTIEGCGEHPCADGGSDAATD